MKLVHYKFETFLIDDNFKNVELIIERPEIFYFYSKELFDQTKGEEGNFVLSDRDKIITIDKNVDIILNPLLLDFDNKKIINKLYDKLKFLANNDLFLETKEILKQINEYINLLEHNFEFDIDHNEEIDLNNFFKLFGIKFDYFDDDLSIKILKYIKILSFTGYKIIVFLNLNSYLSCEDIDKILEEISYLNIQIILLENKQSDCKNINRRYIIDRDLCEIF